MKKHSTLTLVVLAAVCAGSAFAAPPRDGVKDPETGITLHPPKVAAYAPAGTRQERLAAEVKAAMKRVATATRNVVQRADTALHDAVHHDKT